MRCYLDSSTPLQRLCCSSAPRQKAKPVLPPQKVDPIAPPSRPPPPPSPQKVTLPWLELTSAKAPRQNWKPRLINYPSEREEKKNPWSAPQHRSSTSQLLSPRLPTRVDIFPPRRPPLLYPPCRRHGAVLPLVATAAEKSSCYLLFLELCTDHRHRRGRLGLLRRLRSPTKNNKQQRQQLSLPRELSWKASERQILRAHAHIRSSQPCLDQSAAFASPTSPATAAAQRAAGPASATSARMALPRAARRI